MIREYYAYAAGIIDGEGCITLINSCGKIYPSISVQMTEAEPCKLLFSLFSGHYNIAERRTSSGKSVHVWRVTKKKLVASALQELLPFLLIKKPQALVVLDYCTRFNQARGECISVKDQKLRLKYKDLISVLNGTSGTVEQRDTLKLELVK